MIQINKIENLDDLNEMDFAPYSYNEVQDKIFDTRLLSIFSTKMYAAYLNKKPIVFVGLARINLLDDRPELWILMSKTLSANPFLLRTLRETFFEFLKYNPKVCVRVEKGFTAGERLVRFFKFKIGRTEGKYIFYEVNL